MLVSDNNQPRLSKKTICGRWDYNVDMFLKTLVFQVGFFFALSWNEHRQGSFSKLYEPSGEHAYLVCCEDVSKTNQGGPSSCKRKLVNTL